MSIEEVRFWDGDLLFAVRDPKPEPLAWYRRAVEASARGKLWLHAKEQSEDAHSPRDPTPGCIYCRDDPATVEVYGHDWTEARHPHSFAQVFLDDRQVIGLAAFWTREAMLRIRGSKP